MKEKRINGGYEIIESCTIGNNELVIVITPKPPTRMCVGTARTARIYFWGYYWQSVIGSEGKTE